MNLAGQNLGHYSATKRCCFQVISSISPTQTTNTRAHDSSKPVTPHLYQDPIKIAIVLLVLGRNAHIILRPD